MPKPFKRNKPVRKRSWQPDDWDTVSREGRARRPDAPPPTVRAPEDYFSDVDANGVVVSPYGVLAFVRVDEGEILCRVDPDLVDGKSSILAPGDLVQVESGEEGPVVRAVRPRTSKLSRPAVGKTREQVFAANIDHAVIVASVAKPSFSPGLIDRYLIAAQTGGVSPIICINKIDLVKSAPEDATLYVELGVPVVLTSCQSGAGIDTLREMLRGKTSVLAGHSGVGKSSLVNALDPTYVLPTQEISESTNKGRHTTTTSRMYDLAGDIRIVDTPGIKQLGLWGVSPDELGFYFHEIAEAAAGCKFRDCSHTHEPKCTVRDAVDAGQIARARYDSYIRIRASLTDPS